MAKLYYRGMAEQNDRPKIGRSARLLGVRPNIDINIQRMPVGCLDEQSYLLPEPQRQLHGDLVTVAIRDTKGMSVALSIEGLPAFRKPASFGGTGKDPALLGLVGKMYSKIHFSRARGWNEPQRHKGHKDRSILCKLN